MNAKAVSQKATELADSYVSWLRDAGADMMVEAEPVNWLEKAAEAAEPTRNTPSTAAPMPSKAQTPAQQSTADILDEGQWPTSLEALQEMLASGAPLPGNQYGGKGAAPKGDEKAKTMLLLDLPERGDIEAGVLASGTQGILIKNMMAAIGTEMEDCFVTALAFTRPPTGALPEQDFEILAKFAAHQCGLIQPEQMILFGSSASAALLGAELMKARGNLHYFNHNVQKVAAITTFHPRTLLARPQMKAQAWRDLQILK